MKNNEIFFDCPYCWKSISVVVDPSIESQTYVEDCENCCHPIQISYHIENEEIVGFETMRIQ